MKMRQKRKISRMAPMFKHTCDCLGEDFEILRELPESSECVNPKYLEKVRNTWVDVTHKVKTI